jgi:hypothetical protein
MQLVPAAAFGLLGVPKEVEEEVKGENTETAESQ